jgi:hypothetical protein
MAPANAAGAFDFGAETQADTRSWYVRTPDGQTYGPVPRGVLDDWSEQGRVTADSMVQTEGDAEWKPAREVLARFKRAPAPEPRPSFEFADAPQAPAADNPYGSPTSTFPNLRTSQPGSAFYQRPHRGTLVLILGILSWVVFLICCPLGPILGIASWVMGASDLTQMRQGMMDNSGYGMTQAGMIIGIINVVLTGVLFVVYVFFIAVVGMAG